MKLLIVCYCVRLLFSSGKVVNTVFDDYEEARLFSNDMIMKPNVEDAHLWKL